MTVLDELQLHLRAGETEVPTPVLRTALFMQNRGVWHRFSRNPWVQSCRDAANKRTRVGGQGIVLWDELKSFFGMATTAAGHRQYVVVHCRGDRQLDLEAVRLAIGAMSEPERLSTSQLERLGMAYGLVNPFEPWRPHSMDGRLLATSVLQVFDDELRSPLGVPGTVMTNAGDMTWAVEFRADELVAAMDHAMWAPVAVPDPANPPRPRGLVERRPIGIVTGNAPESGIALWSRMNEIIRSELGNVASDMTMPTVLVRSVPEMGLSMELDERRDPVWSALRHAVAGLCQDGARYVAVACNTTQYFAAELREICLEYGAEFIALPDVVADWLRANGAHKVGLAGIGLVANRAGGWSAYGEALAEFDVEEPSAIGTSRIEDLAYEVKAQGPNDRLVVKLRNVVRDTFAHADHIVLALTELSVLLDHPAAKRQRGEQVLIDPLALYAAALAERHLRPVGLTETQEQTSLANPHGIVEGSTRRAEGSMQG